jgi:hypothetical protein
MFSQLKAYNVKINGNLFLIIPKSYIKKAGSTLKLALNTKYRIFAIYLNYHMI